MQGMLSGVYRQTREGGIGRFHCARRAVGAWAGPILGLILPGDADRTRAT